MTDLLRQLATGALVDIGAVQHCGDEISLDHSRFGVGLLHKFLVYSSLFIL